MKMMMVKTSESTWMVSTWAYTLSTDLGGGGGTWTVSTGAYTYHSHACTQMVGQCVCVRAHARARVCVCVRVRACA